MSKTLNIIGGGTVGKTLGRLFCSEKLYKISSIYNRTQDGANKAVNYIGEGRAVTNLQDLEPAALNFVTTNDSALVEVCEELAKSNIVQKGSIFVHCSGALTSSVFGSLEKKGAFGCSAHPYKSFPTPDIAVSSFKGTPIGIEGHNIAKLEIIYAMNKVGAWCFEIDKEQKLIYHSSSVILSNYLTALVEVGFSCLRKAGLDPQLIEKVTSPILRETLENVLREGSTNALTGPIARGDSETVKKQFQSLREWDNNVSAVYRELGRVAVAVSEDKGIADPSDLRRIKEILRG